MERVRRLLKAILERADVFLALAVAIVVSILSLLDLVTEKAQSSATLAVLAVISFVLLREREARESIKDELTKSSRSVDKLRESLGEILGADAEKRIRSYMKTLHQATEGRIAHYSDAIRITYWIADDDQDRVEKKYETKVPKNQVLKFHRFVMGVSGELGHQDSFKDLRIKTSSDRDTDVEFLPLDETNPTSLEGIVFFSPPISGGTRSWSLSYVWKDLWGQLRNDGQDEGFFRHGAQLEVLEIILVFPVNVESPELIRVDEVGLVSREVINGHPTIRWSIQNSVPGTYKYKVKARLR